MQRTYPWQAGARGRLLLFNLLVVLVTLMVSVVAIFGFRHAGAIQEQAQAQTLADMNGSLALARDTANVATAAVRLSQVVGALEYQSESQRLQQNQQALQQSLSLLASAPLAARQPERIARIRARSLMLEQTINSLLLTGHQRHLQRNNMLSDLWQTQILLSHIDQLVQREQRTLPDAALREQTERLITIAIRTPSPIAVIEQLQQVMAQWRNVPLTGVTGENVQRLLATQQRLLPLAEALEQSDLAIAYATYRIKALVAMLNEDISASVQQVALQSEARTLATHRELDSIIGFIALFALLALAITGYAGIYIYRNLGSSLTAIAGAMTRLAQGEQNVSVPGLQRRDELGELARAFNVFARNTASLAHTSRLLKEKSNQLESTFLAMRDGFALFDNNGQLVVWNAQYGSCSASRRMNCIAAFPGSNCWRRWRWICTIPVNRRRSGWPMVVRWSCASVQSRGAAWSIPCWTGPRVKRWRRRCSTPENEGGRPADRRTGTRLQQSAGADYRSLR